jgi:hypothetical protein
MVTTLKKFKPFKSFKTMAGLFNGLNGLNQPLCSRRSALSASAVSSDGD